MGGHFVFEKTFDYGTDLQNIEKKTLNLTSGIVHNVIIAFPAGCQRLVYVRIMKGQTSIWPRNQGAFYRYENFKLPINDYWPLLGGESELTLEGYNIDDSKEHEILVSLQVTDQNLYFAQLGLLDKMDKLIEQQLVILGEN